MIYDDKMIAKWDWKLSGYNEKLSKISGYNEKLSKISGTSSIILKYNKIVDEFNNLESQINSANRLHKINEFKAINKSEELINLLKTLNLNKNINFSINNRFNIVVTYKCNYKYLIKNIIKYIQPLDFYSIDEKTGCYFKLLSISYYKEKFRKDYLFSTYMGDNKFMNEVKEFENIFLQDDVKKRFSDLYKIVLKEYNYDSLKDDLIRRYSNIKNELDTLLEISKLIIGNIFTMDANISYKITKINSKTNKIYCKSLDVDHQFETFFEDFIKLIKNKDIIFDILSERNIKLKQMIKIL